MGKELITQYYMSKSIKSTVKNVILVEKDLNRHFTEETR